MARWLSLLLLVGFTSTALTQEWAGHLGVDAPLAVDVQETASAEEEAEEATVAAPDSDAALSAPGWTADARLIAGPAPQAPDPRPPR